MPNSNPNLEDNSKAWAILIAIIFVAGGYLTAWLIKQKILFHQNMFFVFFWAGIIFSLATVVFFIAFLLTPKEDDLGFFDSPPEFFDKKMYLIIAIFCFFLMIGSFVSMPNQYQKGYGDEALQKLAQAQEKLNEFNYIKNVLTGEEIERLLIEEFDSAMEDICQNHQDFDCSQIKASYEGVKNIFEAKQKADKIARFWGLVENDKR